MSPRLPALMLVPLLVVLALAAACASGGAAKSSSATIPIRYSHYTNEFVTARVGEPITITIRNGDPIEHEWIVGTDALIDDPAFDISLQHDHRLEACEEHQTCRTTTSSP